MRMVITVEQRFERTPDGAVWTPVQYSRRFWDRYLMVFDEVRMVARVRDVSAVPSSWSRADGDGVSLASLPYYEGPAQYLRRARSVKRAAQAAVEPSDAVVLRVGSQIARLIDPMLRRDGHPYGTEVINDPIDIFAPGVIRHPLRPLFRRQFSAALRRQCANACAATYITEHAMQKRYPPAGDAFTNHYSDVDLPPEVIVSTPPPLPRQNGTITLISVGSLAQLYKSPDVAIDAVAICVRAGADVRLVWVGDGRFRKPMEARAAALGLSDRVRFVGELPAGAPVRAELDKADLFLLVSRAEGLGRALIEAMARGLPCIGAAIGGIPELLPEEALVEPGNADALASRILAVTSDPDRMFRMASRNLDRVAEYSEEIQLQRQLAFLRSLRERTEAWLAAGAPSSARRPRLIPSATGLGGID